MTHIKNSPPEESAWDSFFLNAETVSDDFMSEAERLDDQELRQLMQQRLEASKNVRESRIRYRLIPFAKKPNLLRLGFIKKF